MNVKSRKTRARQKCQWCKNGRLPQVLQWEQKNIYTNQYLPVCNQCAKRKLRLVAKDGFASALIDIRQIAKPGHEHPAEQRTGEV